MLKPILWVGGTIALALTFVVGAGFLYWKHPLTVAVSPTGWADFGTFAGGVLGPLFALFALVAAALASYFQAAQFKLSRDQARHAELQRTIAALSQALDATLNLPPPEFEYMSVPQRPATVGLLLDTLAPTKVFAGGPNRNASAESKSNAAYVRGMVVQDLQLLYPLTQAVVRDFESMAWCLVRLRAAGGDADVLGFYRRRYHYLAGTLSTLELRRAGAFAGTEDFFAETGGED